MRAYIKDNFRNLLEFRVWCKSQPFPASQAANYSDSVTLAEMRRGDYGPDVTLTQLKEGIQVYRHMDLISQLESGIEQSIDSKTANSIPKRKLAYNDLGLGVFSFDRAAQGMYRLKEFYSPLHQVVFEPAEVGGSGSTHFLKADNSPIIERGEERPDGKPKIRTSNKKVFAYFPKVKRMRAAVEIFVSCGNYGNVSPRDFLYSGMVALIIAKKLIKASIPVKINTVIGWENGKTYACAVVPLKNYDEPLDENLLALATSDPSFWRYEGYKSCVQLQNYFGQTLSGAGLTGAALKKVFEANKYRLDVPNRFYFGRVENEREARLEISRAIEQISNSIT